MKLTKIEIDENQNIIENMTYNKNNTTFKFMNNSNIKSHFDNIKKNY